MKDLALYVGILIIVLLVSFATGHSVYSYFKINKLVQTVNTHTHDYGAVVTLPAYADPAGQTEPMVVFTRMVVEADNMPVTGYILVYTEMDEAESFINILRMQLANQLHEMRAEVVETSNDYNN